MTFFLLIILSQLHSPPIFPLIIPDILDSPCFNCIQLASLSHPYSNLHFPSSLYCLPLYTTLLLPYNGIISSFSGASKLKLKFLRNFPVHIKYLTLEFRFIIVGGIDGRILLNIQVVLSVEEKLAYENV